MQRIIYIYETYFKIITPALYQLYMVHNKWSQMWYLKQYLFISSLFCRSEVQLGCLLRISQSQNQGGWKTGRVPLQVHQIVGRIYLLVVVGLRFLVSLLSISQMSLSAPLGHHTPHVRPPSLKHQSCTESLTLWISGTSAIRQKTLLSLKNLCN